MTKEEIIEQLENTILLIMQNGKDYMDERDIPMLKVVIQTLKQQSCKDTISRQAGIDAIAETIVNGESLGYSLACDILSDLPSVQPEQKLIRCKDCKHLYQDGECPLRLWKYHIENDFCSYAERKMEDGQLPSVQPTGKCWEL